jgi:osmoprotectant transport system ATP-binding protein
LNSTTQQPAIELKLIDFSYQHKPFISGLNLSIHPGRIYALIGSSGSGKTTLLRLMNGLVVAQKGEVYIDGRRFDPEHGESWRRSMGYSIQGSGLFPHMTLKENLVIIARKQGWSPKQMEQRIEELFRLMGLPHESDFLNKKPGQISGGQQQRVGIARALFLSPKVMLMDEPFSALDPISRGELQQEFLRLQKQLGLTIVMVTHDLSEAFTMADELILINNGKVEQQGRPSQFLLSPQSPYVKDFIKTHSPGNRLKEVFLYSVVNTDLWCLQEHQQTVCLIHLESSEKKNFTNLEEAKKFLSELGQNYIYAINPNHNLLYFQSLNNKEAQWTHSLSSTDSILEGMKLILQKKVDIVPVLNQSQQIIGVFSEGALDAL